MELSPDISLFHKDSLIVFSQLPYFTPKIRSIIDDVFAGGKGLVADQKEPQVYDEYVALVEMPHALAAIVDGHLYEAGFNASRSFIAVDGQEIASKLRLI